MKPVFILRSIYSLRNILIVLFSFCLFFAAAQNRVGIGTSTPAFSLDVQGPSHTFGRIKALDGYAGLILDKSSAINNAYTIYRTQGVDQWTIGMRENNHFTLTNWAIGFDAFTINNSTNFLGLGVSDPAFRLDVNGRMRLRANNGTAGLWLNNNANTLSIGFMGVSDDNHFGFWGNTGVGWSVVMNTDNGYLGIKNAIPQTELHIIHGIGSGADYGLRVQNAGTNNNQWTMYTVNGSGNLELYRNGIFRGSFDQGSGAYTAASDARLKKNIQSAGNMLNAVMNLSVKRYQFRQNDNNRYYYGFLAQELETVFPELVFHNKGDDGSEYYSLDYSGLGVIALKSIQEMKLIQDKQQAEIEQLRQQNKLLELQLEKLQEIVAAPGRK